MIGYDVKNDTHLIFYLDYQKVKYQIIDLMACCNNN